jgi:hypothetical protein
MSFIKDPFGNISGGIHDLGKGIANATKNPLVDMAAAAALDYFTGGAAGILGEAGAMGSVTGLGAAGNAALLTGGIAGLASGNLAQGLMAGLAGYGGASAGESLGMGGYGAPTAPTAGSVAAPAGTPTVGNTVSEAVKAGTQGGTLAPSSVSQFLNAPGGLDEELVNTVAPNAPATATPMPQAPTSPYALNPTAPSAPLGSGESLKLAANTPLGTSGLTAGSPLSTSGLGSLAKDPSLWTQFKALPWYAQAGIGAAGIAGFKAMAKPQALNVPKGPNTQFIRNYNYNPFGGYSGQGVIPAAATGGIVALAQGGVAHFDDGGFTNQQISDYVSNIQAQGGGDKEIAAAMDQFHVGVGQLAGALGMNTADVQSRYNAATPTGDYYTGTSGISNQDIRNALKNQYAGASDATLYNAMVQNKIDPTQMAYATSVPLAGEGNIADRYALAQDITKQGNIFGQYQGPGTPMQNLGSTYDQNWANWMDTHKDPVTGKIDPVAVKEMARVTGISEDEIGKRYAAAEAILHPVKTDKTDTKTTTGTSTGLTSLPVTTTVLPTTPMTNAPAGTSYPYGNVNNPGDIILNPDGSKTVVPNIPGRPRGAFSGVGEVTNAFTAGGGHTGYVSPTVKDMAEFTAKYDTQTGGSKAAFDYLMGKSPYPTVPYTPTGEISKPYSTSVMGMPANPAYMVSQPLVFDPTTRTYKPNPNFDPHFSATRDYLQSGQVGISAKTAQMLGYKDLGNGIYGYPNPDGTYIGTDGKAYDANGKLIGSSTPVSDVVNSASGGLMNLAAGGMSNLGGYSDGGRLLRGPGDGVSDSIPASIGDRQPARLADGEFVVPARIVSEIGNGSTEAGARKLYAMMDRVQNARKKTTGKNQVAANPRAEQYLPA